jgi:hypothetical protein
MKANAPTINIGQASSINFDVKEQDFAKIEEGKFQQGIPIASKYEYEPIPARAATPTLGAIAGRDKRPANAIGSYLIPPNEGTYVLASVDGEIKWLETESCD